MKVLITYKKEPPIEFVLESDQVIVGRGTNCDIVLDSDFISRKHLEITSVNDEFFIKDLTLSNWVSYNQERLQKDTVVPYFDFAELLLPGDFVVKIINDESAQNKSANLNKKDNVDIFKGTLTNAMIKADKKSKKKVLKEEVDIDVEISNNDLKDEKVKKLILVIILITTGVYYYLDSVTNEDSVIQSISEKKKIKKIIPIRINESTLDKKNNIEQKKNVEDGKSVFFNELIAESDKCSSHIVSNICSIIFKKIGSGEGIIVKTNSIYILKNYSLHVEQFFDYDFDKIKKGLSLPNLKDVIAAEMILLPSILEKLEKLGITKVHIYLFEEKYEKAELLESYLVETAYYRRFDLAEYNNSYKKIKEEFNFSLFEKDLQRFLTKE